MSELITRLKELKTHVHEEAVRSRGCVIAACDTIDEAIAFIEKHTNSTDQPPPSQAGN